MMTSAGSAVELKRDGKALNHVRAVSRHRGLRDRSHGPVFRAGVILGDDNNKRRHDQPHDAAIEEMLAGESGAVRVQHRGHADELVRHGIERKKRENAGRDKSFVERTHDGLARSELHEERTGNRCHDTGRADGKREDHHPGEKAGIVAEIDRGKHHRRNNRHGVGFEQVRRHTRAVADIVADVIGNRGRVARIVLGDAGFDLADEVAANVRTLGEDAAAETGEDGDQRGAEAERNERIDNAAVVRLEVEGAGEDEVVAGNANQCEACDKKSRHGTGLEGHRQTSGETFGRSLRRADIRADRHEHADEARGAREHGADQESNGDRNRQKQS